MAVAAITEPPGGLTCIDLFRDPLVLVVRRDHALAAAGDANWEAIGKERLVLFESGSMPALGNPARAQFAQGAEPYRVSYSETLYALVRSGQALGLMPRLYTSSLRDPELVVVPLLKPRVERRVVLAYLPGPMRNVVAQELIAFLRDRLPQAGRATVRRMTKGSARGDEAAFAASSHLRFPLEPLQRPAVAQQEHARVKRAERGVVDFGAEVGQDLFPQVDESGFVPVGEALPERVGAG
jgi:hypothetical protein